MTAPQPPSAALAPSTPPELPVGAQWLQSVALELSPGMHVVAAAVRLADGSIVVPVQSSTPWGSVVRAWIQIDDETYSRALRLGRLPGFWRRLESFLGTTVQVRPILPR
jgi:hypothetical protein